MNLYVSYLLGMISDREEDTNAIIFRINHVQSTFSYNEVIFVDCKH